MIDGKRILAVIPARGGSKGLPGKNIKPLLGKPLIGWTIEQAKESKYIDRIIVSTDDKEIAEVSLSFGAGVPFTRPPELATDDAKTVDVVMHSINYLESINDSYDIIVLLEPTSPLREVYDIDTALEMLVQNPQAESIVGIAKVESQHPSFIVKLHDKFIKPYSNENFRILRRQDIETLYYYEGSLYIFYTYSFKNRKQYYHEKTMGYVVPKWKAFEVDDEVDFMIVEEILNKRINGKLFHE